jgi:hypothetical protein
VKLTVRAIRSCVAKLLRQHGKRSAAHSTE